MPILTAIANTAVRPARVLAAACILSVLGVLGVLGFQSAGPAQAAPQLAERAQIAERIVAAMERRSPYFRILFEDHPHERAAFIRALEQARRFGGRESMMVASIAFGSRMGWRYFPYYYTRTSDDAVLAYARVMRDSLSLMRAGSYEDCYDYLAGSANDRARALRALNAGERRRTLRVMTAIVVHSRRNDRSGKAHRKPGPDEYRRPVNALLARLTERLGEGNLVHWKRGLEGEDQKKACDYAIAFFEEVLKQPKRDGVVVLRTVFGEYGRRGEGALAPGSSQTRGFEPAGVIEGGRRQTTPLEPSCPPIRPPTLPPSWPRPACCASG